VDPLNRTGLIAAIENENVELIRILLEAGIKVKVHNAHLRIFDVGNFTRRFASPGFAAARYQRRVCGGSRDPARMGGKITSTWYTLRKFVL